MNKQPIAKTYHANISPGSGDGPVLTLDRAICQGRENTPIASAEDLKALIVAKGVADGARSSAAQLIVFNGRDSARAVKCRAALERGGANAVELDARLL